MIDSDDDIYIYLCKEQKKNVFGEWMGVCLFEFHIPVRMFLCVHVVLCNSCNTNVFVSINAP